MSVPAYLLNDGATTETIQSLPTVLVSNSDFFPVLDLREFESVHQIDASYSEKRRLYVLLKAVQETNAEIDHQVCQWVRAGYFHLEDVPQDILSVPTPTEAEPNAITEIKSLVTTYKSAVFAKGMQLLNERYRGTDTKEYAVPKAANMEAAALNYEHQYRRAIYTLTGLAGSSICVEMI